MNAQMILIVLICSTILIYQLYNVCVAAPFFFFHCLFVPLSQVNALFLDFFEVEL